METEGQNPRSRASDLGRFIGIGLALFLVTCFIGVFVFSYFRKHPLPPSGGVYFPWRVEIPVPHFRQSDPQWHHNQLGWSDGTIGGEGCALCSAAMVMKFYGIDTDPARLNDYLSATGGYTKEGWIYWEAATNLAPDRVRKAYEDAPSYFLIDRNLLWGNPVIVRLRLSNGITHFVVISGKKGFDYLIQDPMAGEGVAAYPLRQLGSPIEALRYYEKLK